HARKYDEAIAECKSALAVNPDFAPAHTVLGHAYVQKRMFPEASAEYQKVLSLSGGTVPAYLADLGYLYGVSGKPADAMAVLTKLHDLRRQLPFVGFTTEALVYAGLNHKEMAIAYLEKAGEQNDANLIWARSDPRWQMISSDPRLSALLPPATAAHVR
ncbi:MAG: hypothetical protein HY012_08140, partial [Acidobacteria bacterium]|nr:hypothetical protein [Acidobacteriota bacterium]